MSIENVLSLASSLIEIPSLTGSEQEVVNFTETVLRTFNQTVDRIPVKDGRDNLFVAFGQPKIVFTTHLDVVPGPASAFKPRISADRLFGRGACDAKGIAAVMIEVCRALKNAGEQDFGLLLVVDEEIGGTGALAASKALQKRGIRYLINGEPTECVLASRQNGAFDFRAEFQGRACHSGCPERGDDANQKLFLAWDCLRRLQESELKAAGIVSVNPGKISGGNAANIISPFAVMEACVRTSVDNSKAKKFLENLLQADAYSISFDCSPLELFVPENWPSCAVSFGSDLPNFAGLEATPLLFGPGSIADAHTDDESVSIDQLSLAFNGYRELFATLQAEPTSQARTRSRAHSN